MGGQGGEYRSSGGAGLEGSYGPWQPAGAQAVSQPQYHSTGGAGVMGTYGPGDARSIKQEHAAEELQHAEEKAAGDEAGELDSAMDRVDKPGARRQKETGGPLIEGGDITADVKLPDNNQVRMHAHDKEHEDRVPQPLGPRGHIFSGTLLSSMQDTKHQHHGSEADHKEQAMHPSGISAAGMDTSKGDAGKYLMHAHHHHDHSGIGPGGDRMSVEEQMHGMGLDVAKEHAGHVMVRRNLSKL